MLAWPFLLGYFMDLVLGDPPDWPHPVRALGWLISFWERQLYRPRVIAGLVFWLAVAGSTIMLLFLVLEAAHRGGPWVQGAVATYLVYAGLATRSLHLESQKVEAALAGKDLEEARRQLSCLVSRETGNLPPGEVRRAILETVAENLSDGVVAPLFYLLMAGLPGLVLYKVANTMDSMVGYQNERYQNFGKVAARVDDVLNFVPARLTAGLICLTAGFLGLDRHRAWETLREDGHKTPSPNAGWPEAALAGALKVRLGGPGVYFGRLVNKPFIGKSHPTPGPHHYSQAVALLYGVSLLMAVITFFGLLLSGAGLGGLLGVFI
jgi:adenosylcobinamide-phosphate synthase